MSTVLTSLSTGLVIAFTLQAGAFVYRLATSPGELHWKYILPLVVAVLGAVTHSQNIGGVMGPERWLLYAMCSASIIGSIVNHFSALYPGWPTSAWGAVFATLLSVGLGYFIEGVTFSSLSVSLVSTGVFILIPILLSKAVSDVSYGAETIPGVIWGLLAFWLVYPIAFFLALFGVISLVTAAIAYGIADIFTKLITEALLVMTDKEQISPL